MIISKELLCEVLDIDERLCRLDKLIDNTLFFYTLNNTGEYQYYINIYEFAHKCKERIEKTSTYSFIICEGIVYVDSSNSLLNEGGFYFDKKFYKHTEIENILTACQWLFDNKRIAK